jgi:dienelactone hydrolase
MKYFVRVLLFNLCVIFSLFIISPVIAQTHTPKYVAMSSHTKAYYEYLPEGYNPSGTTLYPVILFMTGIGELGDGSSSPTTGLPLVLKNGITKNIEAGIFPKSFTCRGKTFRFIIITPQFVKSPRPTPADMDTVLTYILSHYKVDPKRVYITGLSYGGGLSFAYAGSSNANYRSRVTAIVPTASPLPDGGYDTIYTRSRRIAASNIPVWATHNSGDTPDSASRTTAYINDINQAPAPNPLAKKIIFTASGHDSWSKTYDPDYRDAGYDVFEWMLLYQKGTTPPTLTNVVPTANAGSDKTLTLPTNSITLTGSGADGDGSIAAYSWRKISGPIEGTITSPTAASTTVTGLARGTYIFRLTVSDNVSAKAIDDVKVTVNSASGTKAIQVKVLSGTTSSYSSAWNTWAVGSSAGTNITSTAFKYVDGTSSTVTATLSATTTVKDNYKDNLTYGNGVATIAPTTVLRYTTQYNATRTLTLQGLSTTKTYNLEFYASLSSTTQNYNTVFTINGASVSVGVNNNLTNKAAFANIAPTASGTITISIAKSNTYNYLNGFTLTENANTRFVKINLYGGTNPYNNTAWNNWNVGTVAATNISSGTLKYSDGTTSAVKAVLSATNAVVDNGSTYGSGMAPAEVLRYVSNHNATRTLTFSGLSNTKTYSLELYSSRNASTAGNTVFNVNGAVQTVNAASNKLNKATFINLIPNSSGQLVVTISKTSTYSHLNGFVLGEGISSASTTAMQSSAAALENVTERNEIFATGVRVCPNPMNNTVQLQLQNSYTGEVHVQLADVDGRLQKEWRFEKAGSSLLQTLNVDGVANGVYFITVQMGAERKTLRLSKLD